MTADEIRQLIDRTRGRVSYADYETMTVAVVQLEGGYRLTEAQEAVVARVLGVVRGIKD